MARRASQLFLLLFTVAMVGCDHATKVSAKSALEGRSPLDLLSGVLDLRYTENHDTAFSVLDRLHFPGKAAVITLLGAVALAAIAFAWWRRRSAPGIEQAGFRLVRGYVVDFIHVAHWPVFNVADAAIVAGAFTLLLARSDRLKRS